MGLRVKINDIGILLICDTVMAPNSCQMTQKVCLISNVQCDNLYADIKIIHSLFVTLYTQQKVNDDNNNSQITTQNIFSITPRLSRNNFEMYSTWASNEISGLTGGLGFRAGGFFIGSNSFITSYFGNSKQLDFYLGLRFGFGKNN